MLHLLRFGQARKVEQAEHFLIAERPARSEQKEHDYGGYRYTLAKTVGGATADCPKRGPKPETLAIQFLREGIARRKTTDAEFVPWEVAAEIGNKHGRSWSSGTVARKWVERENREAGPSTTSIRTRRGQVHREDLVRALQNSQRWKGE